MTGKDFVKPKPEPLDRYTLNYKLTKGEMKFAFFYIRISAFTGLTWFFIWVLQIATR